MPENKVKYQPPALPVSYLSFFWFPFFAFYRQLKEVQLKFWLSEFHEQIDLVYLV